MQLHGVSPARRAKALRKSSSLISAFGGRVPPCVHATRTHDACPAHGAPLPPHSNSTQSKLMAKLRRYTLPASSPPPPPRMRTGGHGTAPSSASVPAMSPKAPMSSTSLHPITSTGSSGKWLAGSGAGISERLFPALALPKAWRCRRGEQASCAQVTAQASKGSSHVRLRGESSASMVKTDL